MLYVMRTRLLAGTAASAGAIAVVTGAIYALDPVAPVLSLGVLYLFAVLPVAAIWGLRFAVPVSIVAMLAFNFFFLPPRYTFHLAESENWVALAVYLVHARSRQRAARRARGGGAHRGRALKTAVLRSVSHDLRSPLTAIRTASEMLGRAALPRPTARSSSRRSGSRPAGSTDWSATCSTSRASRPGAASPRHRALDGRQLVAQALDAVDDERITSRCPSRAQPVRVDAGADRARARQPGRERARATRRRSTGRDPRRAARRRGSDLGRRPRARASPLDDREAIFEPFWRGAGARHRSRARDRARVRRAERRPAHGRVGPDGGAFALALPAVELPAKVSA